MAAPAFCAPLAVAGPYHLINAHTGHMVAAQVEPALTRRARKRGLLGRDSLDPASALVIAPCFAIHTIGMRFAIDVLFVDRGGHVLKIVTDLDRWRFAAAGGAYAAIEFASGALASRALAVGDRLYLAPASQASLAMVAPRWDAASSQNSTTRGWPSSAA